jgi:multicomponent K+:H+ antiporter subunit D
VLAAQKLDRLGGFMVVVSSGTLLAAFGFTGTTLTAPALYYLASSVLGSGAFFMLIELAERNRTAAADLLAISFEAFGLQDRHESEHPDEMAGVAIPAAMAFLGLAFFSCAAVLSGLPPLSGFVAKFALLKAAIAAPPVAPALNAGLLFTALLLSGLAALIALSRLGIRVFWDSERPTPRLQWLEAGPVAGLVLLCFALAFGAGPAMAYFEAAARALHDPATYIGVVLSGGRP